MCRMVVINRGEKEINTPREFKEHFGFLPKKNELYALNENEVFSESELDECLCSADLVKTLRENKVNFRTYLGDVYIVELELVQAD